jgi:hypothetical protein
MLQPHDSPKPYTRWWWFNGPIRKPDVRYQLDWLKQNGFGGVEIAFLYAQPGAEPGPEWLSPEWSAAVADAKQYAESIGLGCDFTFCSAWPFGGSIVEERDASRTFNGLSRQRVEKSWETTPVRKEPSAKCAKEAESLACAPAHLRSCALRSPLYILNHLDRRALERYAEKMGAALKDALAGTTSRLFCDSFEVEPEGLWSHGLDRVFIDRFGYDLRPFMRSLDEHPDVRYDYRRLISDTVLNEFYRPFNELCHGLGALSRVQCLGTPTDLLAAYGAMDVPESEAILFDPHFSQFAASDAAVANKRITSAESFTCLYGWKPYPGPGPFQGQEQIADIKLLADALFANGINSIIWHGMPYNPPGGKNRFYASVHVGPDSSFAAELPEFNRYLEQVSTIMRQGRTYSDVAVYLPLEDNWMQGRLPPELRRPSAEWCWELQYERFPDELLGFRPLWVSMGLLKDADYRDGKLRVGSAEFNWLYIDVEWLDASALRDILRLAKQGLPVVMRRRPTEPGKVKHEQYESDVRDLLSLANAQSAVPSPLAPLLSCSLAPSIPEFWCRVDDDEHILFFAHPATRHVHYPMRYGQSAEAQATSLKLKLSDKDLTLDFPAYGSLLVRVSRSGKVRVVTPDYTPPAPVT